LFSLQVPVRRHIAHKGLERHMGRLRAFQNSLRNVGCEKGYLHYPPHISAMEAGLGCNRSLMRLCLAKIPTDRKHDVNRRAGLWLRSLFLAEKERLVAERRY